MIKVLFICHGNICRSPMCHFYFQSLVDQHHLESYIQVDSAATSTEEIGNPVHPGTRRKLVEVGIRCDGKKARQMTRKDCDEYDYLIGMDSWNIRNMQRIAGAKNQEKIYKLLEFAETENVNDKNRGKQSVRDVADPWYTGDFEQTWKDTVEGCQGLLQYILEHDFGKTD